MMENKSLQLGVIKYAAAIAWVKPSTNLSRFLKRPWHTVVAEVVACVTVFLGVEGWKDRSQLRVGFGIIEGNR